MHLAVLVSLTAVSLLALASRPSSAQQKFVIKNWNTDIDFDIPDTVSHEPIVPQHPTKIHRLIETFTTFTFKQHDPRRDFFNTTRRLQGDAGEEADNDEWTAKAGSIQQDFDHFTEGGEDEGKKWVQHFYYTTKEDGEFTGQESEINFLMLEGEGGWGLGLKEYRVSQKSAYPPPLVFKILIQPPRDALVGSMGK